MSARAGALAAAAVAAVLLSACDKPIPEITLLSGSTVSQVAATSYCFNSNQRNCHVTSAVPRITATSSSTIMVTVPRSVAESPWIVSAFRLDDQGTRTPLDGYGSPALLQDTHSTRVAVPFGTGEYFLSVAQIEGAEQRGTWTVRVDVSG
jgi:hypothetical protein